MLNSNDLKKQAEHMLEFINPARLVRTLDQISGSANEDIKKEEVIIASDFFREAFKDEIAKEEDQ